jgi:hypothetical protein
VKCLVLVLVLCLPSFAARRCETCQRDSRGHIQRTYRMKHQFRLNNPCPGTGRTTGKCRGYVIDHRIALCDGGKDSPSNMQWQTTAEAKAKDKTECQNARKAP